MSVTIIPTVLAYNMPDFNRRLKRLLPVTRELQIDCMDGRFVKTKSIPLTRMPDVRKYTQRFEAHLMVQDPMRWIPSLLRKGYRRIIVHYEAVPKTSLPAVLTAIRTGGAQAVLAINPETSPQRVLGYSALVDGIVVLGVHPGQNHAPYVRTTPARIRALKRTLGRIPIQVDGGMNPTTIRGVVAAGASRINSGSYVSESDDPRAALRTLRAAARGAV